MNRFPPSPSFFAAVATRLAVAVMLCGPVCGISAAQAEASPEPAQNHLERLSAQRGSVLIRSEEIGRIESADARAVITAVVVENAHYRPGRARGVRIDLRDDMSSDRIYIEEDELVYVKRDLDQMGCSVARMRDEWAGTPQVFGIARCRPSQSEPQAWCPSYYFGAESEGLSLSTFAGRNFRFPDKGPAALADAIGQAMSALGIDDEIPASPAIELPDADLEKILTSAVRHFPQLASSPGIKAAGYSSTDRKDSVWAVFWPFERSGDFARSLSVTCEATGGGGSDWNCNDSRARGYLNVAGQDGEIVITGALGRDDSVALIGFVKRALQDEMHDAGPDGWSVKWIRPPDRPLGTYRLSVADGAGGVISVEVQDAPQETGDRFEIVGILGVGAGACG